MLFSYLVMFIMQLFSRELYDEVLLSIKHIFHFSPALLLQFFLLRLLHHHNQYSKFRRKNGTCLMFDNNNTFPSLAIV